MSNWQGYSEDFLGHPSADVVPDPGEYDGFVLHGEVSIGPYSLLTHSPE